MTPAFGFSVGDFISTINLIRRISRALKESGGASSDYQDVVIELKGLKHALQHLEALEPTEDNLSHVNAIRGMALACQLPLRDFMEKLGKYESTLGPWSPQAPFRSASRKARWAIGFDNEVKKLRALVTAKQMSINLLLATQTSEAVSSMNLRTKKEHSNLMSKISANRATLGHVRSIVENIENKLEAIDATSRHKLESISSKSDEAHSSMISLHRLGAQLLSFLSTFPQEVRNLLHSIMQADWRTYQAVLQLQERLARAPTSYHASNIRFTDALGEYRELPFEFFCYWEPFEGFLRSQFRYKPGEGKVNAGQFHVIDITNRRAVVVQKEQWNRSISEGAILTMSIIMASLRGRPGQCPRPGCIGADIEKCCLSSQMTWYEADLNKLQAANPDSGTCHLRFFPSCSDIDERTRSLNISEEDVAKRQADEDLMLYGSRPEPPEFAIVDEDVYMADFPPKRSAQEFEAAVARPAKFRRKGERKELNYQVVTAMDWHSGLSPLDSWLNQSALPSAGAVENPIESVVDQDALAQEEEEIKVFRNIHLDLLLPSSVSENAETEQTKDMPIPKDLGAQIYYRNIMDRYPLLPAYLAHRLALANQVRAERLRVQRIENQDSNRNVLEDLLGACGVDTVAESTSKDFNQQASKGAAVQVKQSRRRRISIEGLLKSAESSVVDGHEQASKGPAVQVKQSRRHRIPIEGLLKSAESSVVDGHEYACLFQGCDRTFSKEAQLRSHVEQHRIWDGKFYCRFPRCPYSIEFYDTFINHCKWHPKICFGNRANNSYVASYVPSLNNLFLGSLITGHPRYHSKSPSRASSQKEESTNGMIGEAYPVSNEKVSDFWTGQTPNHRSRSIHSRSSSMNSSLRGERTFDFEEQEPVFQTDDRRPLSAKLSQTSPAFPPAPVKIGEKLSFECDICGKFIHVQRRREWQ
ncbi:hypothetical protein ACLMJK_008964 [Lecanora helva]